MSVLGLLGPVFAYEWLRMSCRWQMYALRSAFVAVLAAGLTVVWSRYVRGPTPDIRSLAATGEFFFYALIGTQLFVILLAAPAATAGAMGLEKARGEILQLLATDPSSAEGRVGLGLVRRNVRVHHGGRGAPHGRAFSRS